MKVEAKKSHQHEILPSALRPVAPTHGADSGQRTETRFSEFAAKIQETSLSTQALPAFTLQSPISLRGHDTVHKSHERGGYVFCRGMEKVLEQKRWTSTRQPKSRLIFQQANDTQLCSKEVFTPHQIGGSLRLMCQRREDTGLAPTV
ncbi:hypothetical protein KOW79_022473 [Hemibagrus wyckioides]|uniref:Uncharacterized protein n=1 Tax=Hemibagrus wyckioides TaxID=337641 RepID=A0A9D3N197_9TELE|nr:hypothetical protein KOW79_022473 [Hemibagrus wyckioides]